MRVVIEAAALALSSGGLARYTSELSLALAREYPSSTFYLTSDQAFRFPAGAPPNLLPGVGAQGRLERFWWLYGLNRAAARLGADLVHGPDFAVPYVPHRPSVLTLHDLSPWMDPAWHHAASRVRSRTPWLLGSGAATMVITDSETVRRQAIDHFRLAPSRVVAIPLAAAAHFRPVAAAPSSAPYFLWVGTLEPRKRLPLLLDAWRALRREHAVEMVIAGRRRADAPTIEPEPGLHLAGEVAEEALPALYSGALAFVFPSAYEGFGLPAIEAMQCGACVIASTAVREAAGGAALYADTAGELTQAMRAVATQPELLARQRALSLARACEFSWGRTARATHEVYLEARRHFDA